jgi:hypothetical protein
VVQVGLAAAEALTQLPDKLAEQVCGDLQEEQAPDKAEAAEQDY